MRWLVVVLFLGACVSAEPPHRWPDHRKRHDESLADLEKRAAALEAINTELTARVKKLEDWVAHVRVKKVEPPPAATTDLPPPAPAP